VGETLLDIRKLLPQVVEVMLSKLKNTTWKVVNISISKDFEENIKTQDHESVIM